MADAVVSVVVEQIAALIKEQATYHVNLVRGAEKEVRILAKELRTIRNVLDDAERREYKDKSVKDWLLRLEQTSHEMDDVLDEWNYAILKLRMEGDRSDDPVVAAPKKKVWSFFPSSSCLCCKKVVIRHGIAKKIIDVKERLDEVLKEKDRYGFAISQPVDDVSHKSWRDPSTSIVDLDVVCGRESDKDILVTKLMGRQEELGFQVVSIVGVGGLGKTTLAQLVYNDSRVEKTFPLRIWVCVSDPFDLAAIAKGILENMGRGSSSIPTQPDLLLKEVKESISGKRFLLVLDDVWTEDSKKWEPLRISLRCGGEGSKVLVTTRKDGVAITMGTSENDIDRPELLSHGDCWSLLCRISLSGRSEEESRKFEDIGKKIASKCKGLPLAVCALGSLLRFKNSLEEWESVFQSEILELEEAEQQLFPHLRLSYNELSPVLKRCFSYCAIFPKDSKIDVERLVEYWIAQGYLRYDVGDVELKAQECFQNLAMRSLFQDFRRRDYDKQIISCKMHDIVHDFAQSLREDRNSIGVEAGMNMTTCLRCSSSLVSSVKTYRSLLSYDLPYICDCLTSLRVLGVGRRSFYGIPQEMEDLRVLGVGRRSLYGIPQEMEYLIHLRWLDLSEHKFPGEDLKIICHLYNLQFLRLHGCFLKKVPIEIENLIQLRHLDLSSTCLEELSEKIGSLTQLRHLNLSNNGSLKELPEEIGNLTQLRHLDLSSNRSLEELPEEIGNLTQLRHLDLSCNYHLRKLPKSFYGLINLRHIFNYGIERDLLSEGLSKLTNLRTLNSFSGGVGFGRLGWLKNLNLLSGSLSLDIKLSDDSKDMIEDTREAYVRNKIQLDTLKIYFKAYDVMYEENDWMNVMDALEPHRNLQNLVICHYGGSKVSGWITSPLLQLRSIELTGFSRMPSLPSLGKLPCLEEMEIRYMDGLQSVGREFLGIAAGSSSNTTTVGFPKLKKLVFYCCDNWKEWEDITAEEEDSASVAFMPRLEELRIFGCGSLTALPERLLNKKALSLQYVEIDAGVSAELLKRYGDRKDVTIGRNRFTGEIDGLKVPVV